MAIFFSVLKTLSRSRGDSAVAAAAYRAGCALDDERTGIAHDYRRRGGVEAVRIRTPASAPAWAYDAARLWNEAEASERRVNSCVARELVVALPAELDSERRVALAEAITDAVVQRYGVAALVAVHAPDKRGDARNYHAHILFTTRTLTSEGFGKKVRILDDRATGAFEIETLRRHIAELSNQFLANAGSDARVDHRSLRAQAREAENKGEYAKAVLLTRAPMAHEGRAATALARRGLTSERALENGARRRDNAATLSEFVGKASTLDPIVVRRQSEERAANTRSRAASMPRPRSKGVQRNVLSGPLHGIRAEGAGAEVLNAQAALAQQSALVVREGAQAYLDALAKAEKRHGELVDAYIKAIDRPSARDALLAQCARDPWCTALMRQSLEKREALGRLREEGSIRRRLYGAAMKRTADERRAFETLDESAPTVWRPLTRRQWAERRREQRARVANAEALERSARNACGTAATDEVKARARELRAEIRHIENERRRLFPTSARIATAHKQDQRTVNVRPDGEEVRPKDPERSLRARRRPR